MPGLDNMNEHFQSTIQHPVNPQAWSHNNNWWRNNYAFGIVDMAMIVTSIISIRSYSARFCFLFGGTMAHFYSWYGYPYYSVL